MKTVRGLAIDYQGTRAGRTTDGRLANSRDPKGRLFNEDMWNLAKTKAANDVSRGNRFR